MSFIHPGREFVEKYGSVRGREDVLRYAAFLRAESGLGASSAADLTCIYARFHIPLPKRKPLPNQQGLLLMPSIGLMVINSEDPAARQRFTEAHELMELLFDTLPDDPLDRGKKGAFKHAAKERLCNEGAAELLMPGNMFAQRGQAEGVSFATARKLAGEFDVSPTAALVQLARVGEGRCAVALWRMKHKPSDEKRRPPVNQLSLFNHPPTVGPAKKLRVEWSLGRPKNLYIPPYKSIPPESSIFKAWETGLFTTGYERLDFGSVYGKFRCESQPFETKGGRQVISLLEFLAQGR